MGPGGLPGLQNQRDLSRTGWVGSIPTHSRFGPWHASLLVAAAFIFCVPPKADAQQQDSAKAGVSRQPTPSHRAARVDTVKGPPSPPGRAFLYSMLVPGLGQAKLDRAWTGALFAGVEVFAISRWEQAARDLK